MEKSGISNLLWVEKYRPKTIDEIVLPNELKERVTLWLTYPEKLPHLLLIGPAGSGKTSLVNIIVRALIGDSTDYLYVNGSEQRGLTMIRDYIVDFMRFEPTSKSKVKILFIDEADNLTPDAFKALRSCIESYQNFVRILLTGNYDTFPDAILSRCSLIRLNSLPFEEAKNKLCQILNEEKVEYNEEDVETLLKKFYPDMRKTINYLQLISQDTKRLDLQMLESVLDERDILVELTYNYIFVNSEDKRSDLYEKILVLIKKVSSPFTTQIYTTTFINLYKRLKEMDSDSYITSVKLLVTNYANAIKNSVIPEGVFLEFLYKLDMLRRLRKV